MEFKKKDEMIARSMFQAIEYNIANMKDIKKNILHSTGKQKKIYLALGGLTALLTSKLINICNETFEESLKAQERVTAEQDLKTVQAKFNQLIQGMINHE